MFCNTIVTQITEGGLEENIDDTEIHCGFLQEICHPVRVLIGVILKPHVLPELTAAEEYSQVFWVFKRSQPGMEIQLLSRAGLFNRQMKHVLKASPKPEQSD